MSGITLAILVCFAYALGVATGMAAAHERGSAWDPGDDRDTGEQ